MPDTKFSWLADNLEDIKKIAMSIIFIVGTAYAGLDYVASKFVTKAEAANYALKANVFLMSRDLAKTQLIVTQNELFNAKKAGIEDEDAAYYRSLDKRAFKLKVKLGILEATESDYRVPKWLNR